MLIDDNPRYAVECAEAGIDVLLYDWHLSYPWSKTADGCGPCSLLCCMFVLLRAACLACASVLPAFCSTHRLGALRRLHEACLCAGARRPRHSRIRRVQDWIEVEDALAELALLSPQR